MDMILEEGFEISAIQTFNLHLGQVYEFMELYKFAF